VSLMYFEVGATNKFTIGRKKIWGAIIDVVLNGNVSFTNEVNSTYWQLTNQSDYCRLYNLAGTASLNFAAEQLYANAALQVNTTTNIGVTSTVPNTTLGSNEKIDSHDDYHYIMMICMLQQHFKIAVSDTLMALQNFILPVLPMYNAVN
jgi:hypothetical protein